MEDEESFFWWSVIMSKQSWPPPPIFLMILTEESRIFPLKQPGLGGRSEMLQSAARGRMEKLVQTCLWDLDGGWGEWVERERKIDLSLIIDFYITTLILYERKQYQIEMRSKKGQRIVIRDITLWKKNGSVFSGRKPLNLPVYLTCFLTDSFQLPLWFSHFYIT